MTTRQKGRGRANALVGRELTVHIEEVSEAPAEVVYDLLADIRSHLEWGGNMKSKAKSRLLSIEAPEGAASVGTEFRSTGADPMGRFEDTSVVTEASRPGVFAFVTEGRLTTKRGKVVEWTNVHRYELAPDGDGCRISYTDRAVGISDMPGALAMFKIPVLRGLGLKVSGSYVRRAIRNLSRLAVERTGTC